MRIDRNPMSRTDSPDVARPAAADRAAAGESRNPERTSDNVVVDIGRAARAMTAYMERPIQSPRLEEIRTQLAEGTYRIDYDALAENLVDEELARTGR